MLDDRWSPWAISRRQIPSTGLRYLNFPLVGYEGAKTRSPAELRQSMIRRGEPFIKLWVSLPYNKINNTANASVAGNAHRRAASHFHRVNVSLPLER